MTHCGTDEVSMKHPSDSFYWHDCDDSKPTGMLPKHRPSVLALPVLPLLRHMIGMWFVTGRTMGRIMISSPEISSSDAVQAAA